MNSHASMSNYSRGPHDIFYPGYGQNDQRMLRRHYSPSYPMSAAAEPNRYLPGLQTLPPMSTLPHPSAPSSYTAAPLLSPATALPSESSLQPGTRSHFTPMSRPEYHGPRVWSNSSIIGDTSSYVGRQEPYAHDYGNPSGLEHYQYLPNSGRFPPTDVPHQETSSSPSHDGQYGRRPSIIPSYDHTLAQSRHDSRSNLFVPDASRSRVSAPSAILPPIEPGPYRNGTLHGPALSAPFQPETISNEPAVHQYQPPHRVNDTTKDQQQDTPPRRPGPQV
jgi:hypothetical protein